MVAEETVATCNKASKINEYRVLIRGADPIDICADLVYVSGDKIEFFVGDCQVGVFFVSGVQGFLLRQRIDRNMIDENFRAV